MKIKKEGRGILLTLILISFSVHSVWAAQTEKAAASGLGTQTKETNSGKAAKTDYQFSPPTVFRGGSEGNLEAARSNEPKKQEVGLDYKILIGDRLNIKIFPEDQYVKGGTMQVSSEGNVTLPLVGKVKVADKTLVEAGRELAKIIDEEYLVNAEVVIEVVESILKTAEKKKKVIALGQVRRPGSYELPPEKEKITLLELVSLAGGFTEIANIKKIKVIYKKDGKKRTENINGEAIMDGSSPDVELGDGDVVNVAESVF